MTPIKCAKAGVVIAAALMTVGSTYAGQNGREERVLHRFQHAVNTYAALHHELERSLPSLAVTDDMEALYRIVDALAARIREARPRAQEGDFFDPELSELLRKRIAETLRDRQIAVDDLLTDILEDMPENIDRPRINEQFPWVWAAAVPPCLLNVLPDLPAELEYRFADRDLVLIDTHADLVVDVLRDALPRSNPRGIWTWLEPGRLLKNAA